MDPNNCMRKLKYSFIDMDRSFNSRRCHSSSPECNPRDFSRSRFSDDRFEKRTSVSMSRKKQFEDNDVSQHLRKSMKYSRNYELCSSPRATHMHMNTSYEPFDVCLNNMVIYSETVDYSEIHETSVNSKSYLDSPEYVELDNYKIREKHSKEESRCVSRSVKNSKNVSYDSTANRLQRLENDFKLFFANKAALKNKKKLKSAKKSKCDKRKISKNKLQSNSKNLCHDEQSDTLILCIDDEEASEILFGDLRYNLKRKMDLKKKSQNDLTFQ